MTSPEQVRATCEKLSTTCMPYEVAAAMDFAKSKSLSGWTNWWNRSRRCAACYQGLCVCGWHSVSFKQQWMREGSCTCPFVLLSMGGSLCSAQISVEYSGKFQSINHMATDNNWLLCSASHSELHSASMTVKWAAGWAKDKCCRAALLLLSMPRLGSFTWIQQSSTRTRLCKSTNTYNRYFLKEVHWCKEATTAQFNWS